MRSRTARGSSQRRLVPLPVRISRVAVATGLELVPKFFGPLVTAPLWTAIGIPDLSRLKSHYITFVYCLTDRSLGYSF